MKTYNKAIFMPKDKLACVLGKTFALEFSSHAIEETEKDKFGRFQTYKKLTITEKNVIELSLDDTLNVCKLLVRTAYNAFNEVCYVIVPLGDKAMVKTCWLMRKNDNHKSLDKSLYETR
jgi:hypothetical protein